MPPSVNFRSDNVAGVAPEVLEALLSANVGTDGSYGADRTTARLQDQFSELFETACFVQPLATGTAMNALALSLLTPPWGAVLCSSIAHIHDSECGAGELFTGGAKIVPLGEANGKLTPAMLRQFLARVAWGGTHQAQPTVVSITQGTERGTIYSLAEIEEIAAVAREHELKLHMDGARFANAVAALGCSPAAVTWKLGVDVLSFGATKNGAMCAEALVVFDKSLRDPLRFRARKAGQIFSKMRFISAQLEACVLYGLWLRLAGNANRAAGRLARGLSRLEGVELLHDVEINEIFARFPQRLIDGLKADGIGFYDRGGGEVRLVTAFDTTDEQVDQLLACAHRHQG
jgi:threonine aldolase